MSIENVVRSSVKLALLLLVAIESMSAQTPPASSDTFQQKVPGFGLAEQTVVDGVARLSQATDISYSVEFPLGTTISADAPELKSITAEIDSGTPAGILDQLCRLDPTFAWIRIGNTAHMVPRSAEDDPGYLLNRRMSVLELKNISDAQKAIFEIMRQLGGKKEQLAVLQSGIPLSFAEPWTSTFADITVREAFDHVAQQLGSTYGWQFGGAADFRIITFHQRLAPKPRRKGAKSG